MWFTVIPIIVATPPLPPVALPIDQATHLTSSRGTLSHHKIDLPKGGSGDGNDGGVRRRRHEVEEEKQCPHACLV